MSKEEDSTKSLELTLHRCGFVDWSPLPVTSIATSKRNGDDVVALLRGTGMF